MYICPVCGYNQLDEPPKNFNICPCCYTEFGYDDVTLNHRQLRLRWIENGLHWEGMNVIPPPLGWSPIEQLKRAGFESELTEFYNFLVNKTQDFEESVQMESLIPLQEPYVTVSASAA